jgi:hypothetical protein
VKRVELIERRVSWSKRLWPKALTATSGKRCNLVVPKFHHQVHANQLLFHHNLFTSNPTVTMVKLEEVADEDLVQQQDGPVGGEDDWDTDSGTYSSSQNLQSKILPS